MRNYSLDQEKQIGAANIQFYGTFHLAHAELMRLSGELESLPVRRVVIQTAASNQGMSASGPADSVRRIEKFVKIYCEKSGTTTHPDIAVSSAVMTGLARNLMVLGRPLCPCRFYPDAKEELKHRTWVCACDDMQIYKYCHCLLFVNEAGEPITEYLPEDHPGRQTYGLVSDPTPEKGRPLRHAAAMREVERQQRNS